MKRLLTAATALVVLSAPMLAMAQDHHDDHGGAHPAGGAPHGAPPQGQAAPQAHGQQGGQPQGHGPQGGQPQFQGRPQFQGGQPGGRPVVQGQPQFQGRPQFQGGQPGARPGFQGQAPVQGRPSFQGRTGGAPVGGHAGGRPGGQQFAFGGRSFFRYRADPYRFPGQYGNWDHHFWRRGEFLPSVFFIPNYYIGDYWDFGLWAPDYGYQWVRVGADALLVNMATGEVVDVVPGVYYY